MPSPSSPIPPGDRDVLAQRLQRVVAARERLQACRHAGVRRSEELPLRADLLAALEVYAAAITASGAPVPRRLLAEISLYEGLQGR